MNPLIAAASVIAAGLAVGTWFCFPSFFKNTESGSSPTSIE